MTISTVAAHLTGMNDNRVPAGVPTGGQFAAQSHHEADVDLSTEPPGDIETNRDYYVAGIVDQAQQVADGRTTRATACRVTEHNMPHLRRDQVEETVDGAVDEIRELPDGFGITAARAHINTTLARFDTQRRLAEHKPRTGDLMRQHLDRTVAAQKELELVAAKTLAEELRAHSPRAKTAVLSPSDQGEWMSFDGALDENDQVVVSSADDPATWEPSHPDDVSVDEAAANLTENGWWTHLALPWDSPRPDGQPGHRFAHVTDELDGHGGDHTYLDLDQALAYQPEQV